MADTEQCLDCGAIFEGDLESGSALKQLIHHDCANCHDAVNHPKHYTSHPSGVECIQVTEHMNFCRGNAMKYLWRAGDKGDELEDLKKARWYLDREIKRMEDERAVAGSVAGVGHAHCTCGIPDDADVWQHAPGCTARRSARG